MATSDTETQQPRKVSIACPDSEQHVSSRQLLGRDKRLRIQHQNEFYELRITRSGKLILTK